MEQLEGDFEKLLNEKHSKNLRGEDFVVLVKLDNTSFTIELGNSKWTFH